MTNLFLIGILIVIVVILIISVLSILYLDDQPGSGTSSYIVHSIFVICQVFVFLLHYTSQGAVTNKELFSHK